MQQRTRSAFRTPAVQVIAHALAGFHAYTFWEKWL